MWRQCQRFTIPCRSVVTPCVSAVRVNTRHLQCLSTRTVFYGLARFGRPAHVTLKLSNTCRRLSTSSNDPKDENEHTDKGETDVKSKILHLALRNVHVHGWSDAAIVSAVNELGYPSVTSRVLNGPLGLIEAFIRDCNEQLPRKLNALPEHSEDAPAHSLKTVLQTRLELLVPYISNWHEALAILAQPQNARSSALLLKETVDTMCLQIETTNEAETQRLQRKLLTTAIYATTELHLMQNSSGHIEDTWQFLERRLHDSAQIEEMIPAVVLQGAHGLFQVAKNILGVPQKRT
eukprot:m.202122 g.202122  ORF g.202122 m.202122 type:complete len:292 (+) comp32818_c0_seq1:177-1052(+)